MENQSAEVQLFEMLAHELSPTLMVDVGAHKGTMFAPFLNAGWSIHAFEPFRSNLEFLEKEFGHVDSVVLHPEAVSSSSGVKPFHLATKPDGGELHDFYHSLEVIGDDDYHAKGETVAVATVSLDDLVQEGRLPPEVGFTKIDTEGHDLEVLKGGARLRSKVVAVEFWCPQHPQGPSPSPPAEIVELMVERGYSRHIVIEHDLDDNIRFKSSLDDVLPDAWGNLLFFHGENPPFLSSWRWWGQHVQEEVAEVKRALVDKEDVIQDQVRELDDLRAQLTNLLAQLESVRTLAGATSNLHAQLYAKLGALRRRGS